VRRDPTPAAMDRMRFIPGQEAKDEIFRAQGHIYFDRKAAVDFADTFVMQAPGGPLPDVYQTMLACLADGDHVDIWFGLRGTVAAQGEADDPSGELVGHTWATLRTADGRERCLWEVGRRTPPVADAHAHRAFNAYRGLMAAFLGQQPPAALPVERPHEAAPEAPSGKPAISRAFAPSNLYYSTARMWYFVDLSPPSDKGPEAPAVLSRPMRAFDALILSALLTVALGTPPLVFGISNALEGLGKMPAAFTRVQYEGDERMQAQIDTPLLVL
jgi:hypothetical protein